MIAANGLTKTYGDKTAVDGIDFVVEPGRVTGFLGPNGAGKSTTMRMILGLDKPTSGAVTVNGHRYGASPAPLREIGALLEAHAVHPGRSARDHLRWMAASNGIPTTRVGEVLEIVGLESVAGQRAGRFSLGMGQRLGIAAALLGDPPVVILDEPVNGLDPEGVRWVRSLARQLADFMAEHASSYVRVKSPDRGAVAALLNRNGVEVTRFEDELRVQGINAAAIGDLAADNGLRLHELTLVSSSLEDTFMTLTADSVEYHAREGAAA